MLSRDQKDAASGAMVANRLLLGEADAGTYILLVRLPEAMPVRVGGLGVFDLQAGYYLYVGSALRGLRSRLARHLRVEKRLHWHIDYLLAAAPVTEIWAHCGKERYECIWARALAASGELLPSVARFGASDCDCPTHLFYSPSRPRLQALSGFLPGVPKIVWSL